MNDLLERETVTTNPSLFLSACASIGLAVGIIAALITWAPPPPLQPAAPTPIPSSRFSAPAWAPPVAGESREVTTGGGTLTTVAPAPARRRAAAEPTSSPIATAAAGGRVDVDWPPSPTPPAATAQPTEPPSKPSPQPSVIPPVTDQPIPSTSPAGPPPDDPGQ